MVEIVNVAIANETKSVHQFINAFPCLPAPSRPNTTTTRFRLADASQAPLKESPSPLKPTAWADLLQAYPGPLRVHLPMILRFGVELGYQGPQDAFILSKNLASALENPTIIDNKLAEDLAAKQVIEVTSVPPFISSPLGLVPKHNGGFCRIRHLSYPLGQSVNNDIPEGVGELRYTRFQEVLKLVVQTGGGAVIIKKDVEDAFRNNPIAPQHQWLLGFSWKGKFY